MSRTPVHEAVIRLQEEGLVRVLPRRGVVVRAISPDDMREIYGVIIAVEAASAELLAEKPEGERGPAADELDAVNDRMRPPSPPATWSSGARRTSDSTSSSWSGHRGRDPAR